MKKKIALLYGGASNEHDVSVMGYEYVMKLLEDTEYDVLPIYIGRDKEWTAEIGGSHLKVCPKKQRFGGLCTDNGFIRIDAAIPLLHGDGGEDGSVQGALECASIPYVGADVATSAICLDKAFTKTVAESLSIPTVRSVSPKRYENTERALEICSRVIGFPMFVKPRRLGSSVGAFPVLCKEDFISLFPVSMEKGGGLVTVERLVQDKREAECAFAEIRGERIITPPGEILIDGFYGYDEKYGGATRVCARAKIDAEASALIQDFSYRLADALRLRHLARIDYFITDGGVYFNEVNTLPGFTAESLYPKMLEASGISVGDALISFIDDALSC